MAVRRVALTGGVASGKSTVTALLREAGVLVVDADELAREVLAPGTPGLAAVVAEFGPEVLVDDGSLDRPALGRLVFADPAARRRLEAIVHPLVQVRAAELEAELAGPRGDTDVLVVHDIPLLVENGRQGEFDAVVVVDVPEETRVARMVRDRGWTEAEARSRIAAQATREQRLAAATHVVDNTGTHEDLRRVVAEVLASLRRGEPETTAPH